MIIQKLTSYCWKISDKKGLKIVEYFDAYICHHVRLKYMLRNIPIFLVVFA